MIRRAEATIDERLEHVLELAGHLEGLSREDVAAVIGSPHKRAAMERWLEVSVQASIDVASRLVAERGGRTPETYREAFSELVHLGILPSELGQRLRQAAGLRNVLAHAYLAVDPAQLHANLASDAADLRAFCAAVYAAIATTPTDET